MYFLKKENESRTTEYGAGKGQCMNIVCKYMDNLIQLYMSFKAILTLICLLIIFC